ncbi:LPXTG-motif cell wall-anchored protein [Brevibacterium epidermidis]|jgi:LPXTG-motif cell wall-anchored protein|uniref:LPXTG-motif cell wall-anchored protein n=1 Tax=Brevibacterium epidermidis TaxID=1698 RepID=A0ABV4ENW8_BREEP
MKKLALAPAVAIAITGLAASPVIAAPEAPAQGTFEQANVQSSTNQPTDDSTKDAEPQVLNANASLSPEKISQSDLLDPGVKVTVTNLKPGDVVSDDLTDEEATTAKGDTVSFNIVNDSGDASAVEPGEVTFTVTVKRGEETQEIPLTFTVTDDDAEAPEVDPKISVEDTEFTPAEVKEDGIKVTGEGFTPNGKVTLVIGGQQSALGTTEVEANEDGKISGTVKAGGDADVEPGEYGVYGFDVEGDQTSEWVTVTVAEEDETEEPTAPAEEAKLTVSPESITPADFVKEDKGVTLAVENCDPGEDVRFLVNPKGESSVTAFDKTVKADDEGKANVNVYGTSASNASAYVGDYDVTVTCGDDELTGDFSVEKDANAGGGDGDEDGNGGNDDGDNGDAGNGGDLPRTGTELTGLVGGAGLLLIGGVAVAMTMRRKKVAKDPAEI